MIDITALNSIDKTLIAVAQEVKPLDYVEPVNAKEQKPEFLSGSVRNPVFVYPELKYDPKDIEAKLSSVESCDNVLGQLLEEKRQIIALEHRLILNVGNPEIVQQCTSQIYRIPSPELVMEADRLLKSIPNAETPKTIHSQVIRQSLLDALHDYGLTDWKVELGVKKFTTVYPAEKKISVCETRLFAEIDPERLKVHEVGVHALRAANGYAQPLNIFAIGLPGYMETEEGLSSYAEEITGTTDLETMRSYAARVIAVDSVCTGLDFRQTFDRLKSYKLSDNQAWDLSIRAHRGGGFIKDHIYLQGLMAIKDYVANHGDLNILYVGKIGLKNVDLAKELLADGTLVKPKYKPLYLKQK